MTALRALIAAMPDICRALDQIEPQYRDMAFARMADAAERDAHQHHQVGYDSVAPTYDPSHTSVMDAYRDDPLGTR